MLLSREREEIISFLQTGGEKPGSAPNTDTQPEQKVEPKKVSGFSLTPLAELLARPDLPVEYVVENLLVAGTVSSVIAKPKVGKSTFARNL